MEIINSLDEARRRLMPDVATDLQHSKKCLKESRAGIIKEVEDFLFIGGVGAPTESVLGLFQGFIQACGWFEDLACDLEKDEQTKKLAETIRKDYLPSYGWMSERFYDIKELLLFVAKVGEVKRRADLFEERLNTQSNNAKA